MDQKNPQTTTTAPTAAHSTGPATGPAVTAAALCARCGTTRDTLPLTWTCSVENGARVYFCDDCARRHLRSIEGRLDSAWW